MFQQYQVGVVVVVGWLFDLGDDMLVWWCGLVGVDDGVVVG